MYNVAGFAVFDIFGRYSHTVQIESVGVVDTTLCDGPDRQDPVRSTVHNLRCYYVTFANVPKGQIIVVDGTGKPDLRGMVCHELGDLLGERLGGFQGLGFGESLGL